MENQKEKAHVTNVEQGHIAKNCRDAVYNVDNNEHQQWENNPTYDWYQDQWQQEYDQGWHNQDWSEQGYDQGHQQHASSQSAPPASTTSPGIAQSISAMEDIYIATICPSIRLDNHQQLMKAS